MEGVGTGRVEAAVEVVQHSPALLLINWRMSGLLVTMPEPRGKKSLIIIIMRHKQCHKKGRAGHER